MKLNPIAWWSFIKKALIALLVIGALLFLMSFLYTDIPFPKKREPAIGDLGGVSVKIPPHFANFLGYDGDPALFEKRKGPRPERTAASKIRGFAFEIRYPDMVGLTAETYPEKKSKTIHNTTWLSVSVFSGEDYHSKGEGLLEVSVKEIKRKPPENSKEIQIYHVKEDELFHGLVVNVPVGLDKESNLFKESLYYHVNSSGKVDAFIRCSNAEFESAPCKHWFNLAPEMRANVSVIYRRGLLPHWREIQDGVAQTVLSFKK